MGIKGGDNFDLMPDRLARDMEKVLGITTRRCRNCLRGHDAGEPGTKRCGLREALVRDDETCKQHILR